MYSYSKKPDTAVLYPCKFRSVYEANLRGLKSLGGNVEETCYVFTQNKLWKL